MTPWRKAAAVREQNGTKRRRLDRKLYAAEGVVVLGTIIFLIGFGIEKSSNTPGRALEVVGTIIFAVGLFAAAAIGFYLAQHFARTSADPVGEYSQHLADDARPHFGYLSTRMNRAVNDPTTPLVRAAWADPENDVTMTRLIEQERQGTVDGERGYSGDQPLAP